MRIKAWVATGCSLVTDECGRSRLMLGAESHPERPIRFDPVVLYTVAIGIAVAAYLVIAI